MRLAILILLFAQAVSAREKISDLECELNSVIETGGPSTGISKTETIKSTDQKSISYKVTIKNALSERPFVQASEILPLVLGARFRSQYEGYDGERWLTVEKPDTNGIIIIQLTTTNKNPKILMYRLFNRGREKSSSMTSDYIYFGQCK